ncbi:MAG: hypothetical protein WCV92_03265 [Candidatus Buchananbacteria bacterium]
MIDLVISGPDMSGTGTQVNDLINFFISQGKKVRDIRGTEIDALFHAQIFENLNENYLNLKDFLENSSDDYLKKEFIYQAHKLLTGGGTNQDLKISSCIKNDVSTYIDPDSADVWIMEEPTKRGAGQVNRTIEQQRTRYNDKLNATAAALCHQTYRTDEFLRFRKILRENNKIIIRSRSEESACYQIFDKDFISNGISREEYINLPGHKIAFGNPPTHIFIVCASPDWSREEFLSLKKERSYGRLIDDHEINVDYQLCVNRRYSTDWFEGLYKEACEKYNSKLPDIAKFYMYDSKEEIKNKMEEKIKSILKYEYFSPADNFGAYAGQSAS